MRSRFVDHNTYWIGRNPAQKRRVTMSIEKNVQVVKDFFAAMGRGDKRGLLALSAEDIEWIIPGKDWPLAGTHRRHAGVGSFASEGFRNG